MLSLPSALSRAAGQLADPAVLRVLAKSIAVTLAVFVALGLGAGFGIDALLDRWEVAGGAEVGGGIGALLGFVLMLVGGWLLFRIVALAVLQFFADEVVRAVEVRHYPQALASAREVPLREELATGARSTLRAVLVNLVALVLAIPLLFTAIGPALLFWAVNAWLLGHELQELAWARHRPKNSHAHGERAPLSGPERFLLGGTIAGLLAVPFVNLLAPVLGAAAAVHLVHRRKETPIVA